MNWETVKYYIMPKRIFPLNLNYWIIVIFAILFSLPETIHSQSTIVDFQNNTFLKAMDLFSKEKYVASQNLFDKILNDSHSSYLEKVQAQYYSFLCSRYLYHIDVKYKGESYIAKYPETAQVNFVYFQLGNNEYDSKNYKNAIEYYTQIDQSAISDDDRAELNFKKGYSWLLIDSLDKARLSFYEIKDIDNKYSSASLYYYSYIAFIQKNYETALSGFVRLKEDETFAPIVPYYIVQCYYFQDKYDDLISYAVPMIDSVIPSRESEIAYLIGNAYYKKNQYKEAIPYYERYLSKEKNIDRLNYYQPAYCYYQTGNYSRAIPLFEKVANDNSLIGQSASYHLGYCYIQENAKDKALLAFSNAAKYDFDPAIKEDASFNYAVLSYELSNTPFNNSIKVLNDYINNYPNSKRKEEAYNYLITACLNTKNYQEALKYLEKVKNKDARIKKAYQRAAFFRGLELFNNLDFANATKYLELSQKYASSDPVIAARTNFWLGEIEYRNKEIDNALDYYNLFYESQYAKQADEYIIAPYNIGYCYFNKKDYKTASTWFQKFINNKPTNNQLIADAYNRLGDCAFANSKYKEAIDFYTQAISRGMADKDYAMFQKAFCLGLQGNHKQKIELLETLIKTMPNSSYNDDALYEIGQSNLALQNYNEAKKYYKKIISTYPLSSYVKKSWLQLGLIDYNANQYDSAIVKYKKVITDYPNTSEARSALNGIKNIYIELNKVDEFLKLSETLGKDATIAKGEQDSLLYYSAENLYTRKQWDRAAENFKKYLNSFPNGNFITNAHFYLADCCLRNGQYADALEHINYVISQPRNNFTELALVTAAQLNMDKKDYFAALSNCESLDSIAEVADNITFARIGKTLCNYHLSRYQEAINSALTLINTPGISEETDRTARYYLAKSYLALDEQAKAMEQLRKLSKDVKSKEGAEAKYLIAESYFQQNQLDKASKEVFNFINLNTPHQYWIAKAYILLAKIYYLKNNSFQAIKTLESIIDNYDNKDDGIVEEAKKLKDTYENKGK
jgi:TolA-binding protein